MTKNNQKNHSSVTTDEEYASMRETLAILQFTPAKYKFQIHGSGNSIRVGKISQAAYNYWIQEGQTDRFALQEYIDESGDTNSFPNIPANAQFLGGQSIYDFDFNLGDAWGAYLGRGSRINVYDENGQLHWSSPLDSSELQKVGVQLKSEKTPKITKGDCVLIRNLFESGVYLEGNITLCRPFDPKFLVFTHVTVCNDTFLASASYNNQDFQHNDVIGDEIENYSIKQF